jgi:ABC-type sugar transport system substrate-binding protein
MGCVQRRQFLIAMAVLAAPLAAVAQQPGKVWRIGFLALSFQPEYVEAFRKGMRDWVTSRDATSRSSGDTPMASSSVCRSSRASSCN